MSSILLIQSDARACAQVIVAIGTDPSLAVCAAVDTLADARAAVERRIPDLLIADLRLSDGPYVNLLTELRPGRSRTLVLTASLHDPHLMHALRHGADAYLLAGQPPEVLLGLIRQVLAGESAMAPEIARTLLANFEARTNARGAASALGPQALTSGERRLLQWIGEGYLVPEIARGLNDTPQQVRLRIRALYRKMQLDLHGGRPAGRAA